MNFFHNGRCTKIMDPNQFLVVLVPILRKALIWFNFYRQVQVYSKAHYILSAEAPNALLIKFGRASYRIIFVVFDPFDSVTIWTKDLDLTPPKKKKKKKRTWTAGL